MFGGKSLSPSEMQCDEENSGRYYSALGRSHDNILRCADCKRLVTFADLAKRGGCPKCANRRVKEVITLSVWEWLRIKLGLLRFPDSDKFLKEFACVGEGKKA